MSKLVSTWEPERRVEACRDHLRLLRTQRDDLRTEMERLIERLKHGDPTKHDLRTRKLQRATREYRKVIQERKRFRMLLAFAKEQLEVARKKTRAKAIQ